MSFLTDDADEGMAKIAGIGQAKAEGCARLDQLRRLFDMDLQIRADARRVSERLPG